MNVFMKDVMVQPQALKKALETYFGRINMNKMAELKALYESKNEYNKILLTGMGSSHYASYSAAAYLNQHGITTVIKSSSQLLHYERALIDDKTFLIVVSQSGESAEIVSLLGKLPKDQKIIAITNNMNSTLAKRGTITFHMNVDNEDIVSTRTYLATVILLDMIAKNITGELNDSTRKNIELALDNLDKYLSNHEEELERIKNFMGLPSFLTIIGRGFSLSSVYAGALFVKELSKLPCLGIDSGEFRHGPFEIINKDFCGLLYAPSGISYDMNMKMANDIAKNGGKVILVTDKKAEITSDKILTLQINPNDEFYSPIAGIGALQLVNNHIAVAKGLDIGKFLCASKVTTTE